MWKKSEPLLPCANAHGLGVRSATKSQPNRPLPAGCCCAAALPSSCLGCLLNCLSARLPPTRPPPSLPVVHLSWLRSLCKGTAHPQETCRTSFINLVSTAVVPRCQHDAHSLVWQVDNNVPRWCQSSTCLFQPQPLRCLGACPPPPISLAQQLSHQEDPLTRV
jgi:hypothetical protein